MSPLQDLRFVRHDKPLRAPLRWNTPDAGLIEFGKVHRSSINGLERIEPAVLRHLQFLSALERMLPCLHSSGALRREIDPFAIARPAWNHIRISAARNCSEIPALRIDDEDLDRLALVIVKRNPLSVLRPARCARIAAEVCQL